MKAKASKPAFLRWLCFVAGIGWLQCAGATTASSQRPDEQSTIAKGVVIPNVTCLAKPEQGYAVFLPTRYTPERRWPVIYAFDPAARGSVPVALLKDIAEKYGYIVAGSNNSRNGPHQVQLDAAQAMWEDTHKRFAIDERRVYLTGFSGGARAATLVALMCDDCVAGVIAHGAGFPALESPPRKIPFNYFAAIGELDFNYPEMVELAQQLDRQGVTNRLRRFSGSHQWAPAEIWAEAIEWMELLAIKEGRRPKDAEFISRQFANSAQRAKEFEQAGELYAAYQEYRKLGKEFDGLTDVSLFARKAAELEDSPGVRAGEKREKEEIRKQRMLTRELSEALRTMRDEPADQPERSARLRNSLALLQGESKNTKNPGAAKIARRALSQVFAEAYEAGEQGMREKDFTRAARYFEIGAAANPSAPGPFFQLARGYARSGAKKKALEALQRAVENGLRGTALLGNLGDFSTLEGEADFQAIVARLKSSSE